MTYEIVSFGSAEEAAFRDYLETLSDPEFRLDERRSWWCFKNPFGGRYALAVADGRIAATAYYGGKPPLSVGTGGTLAAEIGDTWTHPEHRRKGLFSKLVRHLLEHAFREGVGVIYGTPNSQSTPAYEKLGFQISEHLSSWMWIEGQPLGLFALWPGRRGRVRERPKTERKRFRELGPADYWGATALFPHYLRQDEAYFRWRFLEGPFHYRFFEVEHRTGTSLLAFRFGELRGLPVVILSEMWRPDGQPGNLLETNLALRCAKLAWPATSFVGLYGKAPGIGGADRAIQTACGRFRHRGLPICSATADGSAFNADRHFERFQLSDCDIG